MQITIKVDNYQALEVYKSKPASCIYDVAKKELTFDVNVASGKSYRLIYNDNKFIALSEGQGITMTIWDIFQGTEKECWCMMEENGWGESKAGARANASI